MTPNVILILLVGMATAEFGKYVYVQELKDTWTEAQTFCREKYTDLASINNEHDIRLVQEVTGNINLLLWFGFVKNTTSDKWMWSGGAEVKNFFWGPNQPNKHMNEDYGILRHYKFHDGFNNHSDFGALCFSVHVVNDLMTWEEALQYCRRNHRDLASVASKTEMMQIQSELNEAGEVSPYVWIGLHFLAGDWVWIDGQLYDFDAWVQGNRLSCTAPDMSCAALEFRQGEWRAHNCNERLTFLCY